MARSEPLLPNAAIVARREYVDRARTRLFLATTIVLMGLALSVALAPIAIRYLDRQTTTRIAVVASDDLLAAKAIGVADSLLNVAPAGTDPATWEKTFIIERVLDLNDAQAGLAATDLDGVLTVDRLPSGQLDVTYRTNGPATHSRNPWASA